MRNSKGSTFVLVCAVAYIAGMGLSNHIVYRYFNVAYSEAGYAKAMLPFIALLAVGSLACLHVGKRRLQPSWEGSGKLPLFLVCFVPLAGMSLYYVAMHGALTEAFLIPLAMTALVGIAEETMFRRILYVGLRHAYQGQETAKPLLIAAGLFSLLHAVNILAGQSVPQVLIQLVLTLIAGFCYILMYEYTQNVVLMMALHFLWDFILFSDATRAVPAFAVGMGALQLVQVVSMMVLLRRRARLTGLAVESA